MRPSASSRPTAVTISVEYERDPTSAADALLAMLRPAPQPAAKAPNAERREDPDSAESTAEHPTAA